ncbi:hypothetical protein B0G77_6636 [Paraburkholderia sp. BL10I2N1]|nr:hypothetical protein B0G77_6636 [Paraburkholderia sp. BL10I2N1]
MRCVLGTTAQGQFTTHFRLSGRFRERRLSDRYETMADVVLNYQSLVGRVEMRHHRTRDGPIKREDAFVSKHLNQHGNRAGIWPDTGL